MKKFIFLFLALSLMMPSGLDAKNNKIKPIIKQKGVIADLALMYYGGSHRKTEWNKEQCMKMVAYQDENNKKHWLFDGFLMLEFKDGEGRGFASYYEKENARKTEWTNLCNAYFRKGRALDATNECIAEVAMEIGKPKHRRKAVLTLPEPIVNQKDWGTIDGRALDFSNTQDRIDACKWYIDYAEQQFKAANLQNIDLDGFYWVAEEATHSRDIVQAIGDYMRSKGYKFYWIPYWGSDGHGEWKELKFDYAYQQPNYFFYPEKPDQHHLPNVCKFALDRGMFLEVEFDERALRKNSDYRADRLHDYINAFEKCGALDNLPLAYYIGDCMVYDLAVSSYKEDNDLYNWFVRVVAKRQHARGEK